MKTDELSAFRAAWQRLIDDPPTTDVPVKLLPLEAVP